MSLDYWIDRLEDPFEMFALVQVLRSLSTLADESERRRAERAGWWGVSPKYYSVEDEHDIEVVKHLIGSAFVLARTSITQAVSILKRMHGDAGCPVWIPKEKTALLSTAAPIHRELGISQIIIVNTAADYYKHGVEWKEEDWAAPLHKNKTIANAVALGLGPKATTIWSIHFGNFRFILTTWHHSAALLGVGARAWRVTFDLRLKNTESLSVLDFPENSTQTNHPKCGRRT